MTTPSTGVGAPFSTPPGAGTSIWHTDTLFRFTALSQDTGGRLTAWEQLLPAGSSPPLHVHHDADEAWYVLDGELTFQVVEHTWTAATGTFVWAPRGLAHSFRVESPSARLLGLALPGGFDRFVQATGRPASSATLPPAVTGSPGPDAVHALVASAREHGMDVVGPPMA